MSGVGMPRALTLGAGSEREAAGASSEKESVARSWRETCVKPAFAR